jgi:hypothetical protein
MKKLIVLAGTLFLWCGVSGCGGDSHDTLIKEMIDIVRRTGQVLKSITDEAKPKDKGEKAQSIRDRVKAKAEAAAKELRELGAELQNLNRRAGALRESLSKEEKARLEKEWKAKFQAEMENTNKEWEKLKNLKIGSENYGKEIVKTLEREGALQAFSSRQ